MSDIQSLFADASQLPVADRIQLIEALWETLPDDELPPLSDDWNAEIQRRSAEFDAGTATTFSWEDIKAEARQRSNRGKQ